MPIKNINFSYIYFTCSVFYFLTASVSWISTSRSFLLMITLLTDDDGDGKIDEDCVKPSPGMLYTIL